RLAPGGDGGAASPPEIPPAVSAYTGAGDVGPPPGMGPPGVPLPVNDQLPLSPFPALYPGAPVPSGPPRLGPPPGTPAQAGPASTDQAAPTLSGMLLPAEAMPTVAPAAPASSSSPDPQPAEGAP